MANRGRGRRDDAGVGPYARGDARLVPLNELGGWDVAEGEPDIRGWEVRTLGGRVVGEVSDLLVDREHGEVVMIDIDVKGSDGHTLAPIRAAEVDRIERIVRIDSGDLAREGLPSVDRREDEEDVREAEARRAEERAAGRDTADRVRDRGTEERVVDRGGRIRVRERGVEERVVEQRPVVVEETVVRRRVLGDEAGDEAGEDSSPRKAAEERRDRPDEAR